jgi:hypothetical protein
LIYKDLQDGDVPLLIFMSLNQLYVTCYNLSCPLSEVTQQGLNLAVSRIFLREVPSRVEEIGGILVDAIDKVVDLMLVKVWTVRVLDSAILVSDSAYAFRCGLFSDGSTS